MSFLNNESVAVPCEATYSRSTVAPTSLQVLCHLNYPIYSARHMFQKKTKRAFFQNAAIQITNSICWEKNSGSTHNADKLAAIECSHWLHIVFSATSTVRHNPPHSHSLQRRWSPRPCQVQGSQKIAVSPWAEHQAPGVEGVCRCARMITRVHGCIDHVKGDQRLCHTWCAAFLASQEGSVAPLDCVVPTIFSLR